MTLPSSGSITLAQIAAELGQPLPIDLNSPSVRALAGKPTGLVTMPTDFYGKTANFAVPLAIWTNDPSGTAETTHQVSGYSGNRNLRVERYGFSGDAFNILKVDVYSSSTKTGPWTLRGTIQPMLGGLQYVDFTLATGQWVRYVVTASTAAGKKTGSFEMVIWDLTAGVQISTGKRVDVTVDADNNYVPVRTVYIDTTSTSTGTGRFRTTRTTCYITVSDGATPSSYSWSGDVFGTSSTAVHFGPQYSTLEMTTSEMGTAFCTVVVAGQTYTPSTNFWYEVGTNGGIN